MNRPRRSAVKRRIPPIIHSDSDASVSDDSDSVESVASPPPRKKRKNVTTKKAPTKTVTAKTTTRGKGGKGGTKTSSNSSAEFTPLLSGDILGEIMAMLLPREMLNFCSISKEISSYLTHERVIRSAVVAEKLGVTRRNKVTPTTGEASRLKCIVSLIGKQTIFIPSPMRFLRLLCGTRCERPGCTAPYSMIQGLAVSVCRSCSAGFLRIACTPKYSVDFAEWKDERVAKEEIGYREYMQSQPFLTPGGERAGSLVSANDIENMIWQGKDLDCHFSTLKELPSFPTDQASQQFTEMYDRALKGYASLDEERKLKALIQQSQREEAAKKSQKNREIKKDKILKIINDIRTMLDDPWKEDVLSFSWNGEWKGSPNFDYAFVHEQMSAYTRAPSKATKAKKQKAATAINEAFQVASQSRLGGNFDFLSNLESEEPLEAFMRKVLSRDFSTTHSWLQKLGGERLQHVRAGRLFEAVFELFPSISVPAYMAGYGTGIDDDIRTASLSSSKSRQFAEGIWKIVCQESMPSTRSDCLTCTQQALDMYTELCPWLKTTFHNHTPFNRTWGTNARAKLLENLDQGVIEFIRNKDINGLVGHYRRICDN